jgi:hypothetical protein
MKPVTSGFGFVDLIIPGLHVVKPAMALMLSAALAIAKAYFTSFNISASLPLSPIATLIQAVLDKTSPFND